MAGVVADRVVVELEARLNRYETDVARSETKFTRSMNGIQKSAGATEAMVRRAASGMTAALAGVSVVALARGFLSIADEAKNLDAQLKLATAQTGSFGKATQDVRRIAEATRSGLSETATLYGNFARNARELGINQTEAARATETVAKTFKISGAGAVEASQGTRQLVQALQSGILRGDEFNSIMESSPRLARLLADSLGVPIGSLRAMAEEGELTSDKLVRAFTDKKFTDGIDAEFRELPVTFDQAMTQVYNAAIITFGAFDRGGEFSTALANFITQGTGGFGDLERSAEEFGISARANIEGLASAFAPVFAEAQRLFEFLDGGFKGIDIGRDIQKSLDDVDRFTGWLSKQGMLGAALTGNDIFGANGTERGTNFGGRFRQSSSASRGAAAIKAEQRKQDAATERASTGASRVAPAAKAKKGPSAETLARRAEASRLAAERRQQAFDNEEAGLQQDIIAARRALSNSAAIRAQLELQDIEAERVKYNDNLASMVEQKRYTQAQADTLRAANDNLAALREQVVTQQETERLADQALTIAQADLRDAQEIEQLNGQLADTREKRRASELRLLDLQYREEKLRLERIRDDERLDQQVRDQAARSLDNLETSRVQRTEAINRSSESPLDRYRREVGDVGRNINDSLEQIQVDGLQSLNDGITEAIMGAKSLGDVFKNVANQIIADLIRIAVQQAIIAPLAGALFGGGGGGLIGGLASGSALGGNGFAPGESAGIPNSWWAKVARGTILSGLPGFASGGSMLLGGRGGTDANQLALNGRPIANVSRGETLNIGSKPMRGSSSGAVVISSPRFDLRGAVMTPQLYADMQRISDESAARAGTASYRQSMRDAPTAVRKAQRFGNGR